MDISIIIVTWNSEDTIGKCLGSIKNSVEEYKCEVIVIDNNSQDKTTEIIKNYYKDIILLINAENKGFAKACNQGAKLSSSAEYLLFLNPDLKLKQGCIGKLVEMMNNHPEIGIIGARILNEDGSVQNSVRKFPNLLEFFARDTILKYFTPYKRKKLAVKLKRPHPVNQVSGACMLIRKRLFEELDGFDERFFMFYEEVDLCKRCWDSGHSVYYFPYAEGIHTGGSSRHKDKAKVLLYSYRSRIEYVKKYYPKHILVWFYIAYIPLFLINTGLEGLKELWKKRGTTKLKFLKMVSKSIIDFRRNSSTL